VLCLVQLAGPGIEVLVEGPSLRNSARWAGRTRSNKIAIFDPAPGLAVGDVAEVAIERAMPQTVYGALASAGPSCAEGAAAHAAAADGTAGAELGREVLV
jgi:hypothetical protein